MLFNVVVLAANSNNSDDDGDTCHLLSTYSLPGVVLNGLHVKTHFVLTTTPEKRHYYSLFPDEETEAQRLGDLPKVYEVAKSPAYLQAHTLDPAAFLSPVRYPQGRHGVCFQRVPCPL